MRPLLKPHLPSGKHMTNAAGTASASEHPQKVTEGQPGPEGPSTSPHPILSKLWSKFLVSPSAMCGN